MVNPSLGKAFWATLLLFLASLMLWGWSQLTETDWSVERSGAIYLIRLWHGDVAYEIEVRESLVREPAYCHTFGGASIGALRHQQIVGKSNVVASVYERWWSIPLWWFATLSGGCWAYSLMRYVLESKRAQARAGRGSCPACGYDLRASTDRCPECRAAITPQATANA